jgi:molybdopterin-guanine dinucleotide biosynthesis protein
MKAIGIVGFKKSGKTALPAAMARELSNKLYRLAGIKHSIWK